MRGQGRVFRPEVLKHRSACTVRGRGNRCDCPRVKSRVWWLDYTIGGKRHRECSNEVSKTDAQRILRLRIGDRETGKVTGRPDRVVLAEYVKDENGQNKLVGGLRWLHEAQYDLDGLRSKDRVQQCWSALEAFLGAATKATEITPVRLDEYVRSRLAQKKSRQTANHELSALRRAYNLAIE